MGRLVRVLGFCVHLVTSHVVEERALNESGVRTDTLTFQRSPLRKANTRDRGRGSVLYNRLSFSGSTCCPKVLFCLKKASLVVGHDFGASKAVPHVERCNLVKNTFSGHLEMCEGLDTATNR